MKRILGILLGCTLCLLLGTGCDNQEPVAPDKLSVVGDKVLFGALESELPPIHFDVKGKPVKTALGGKDTPLAADIPVRLSILSQPENANATLATTDYRTDAGGRLAVSFRIGKTPGLYRLRADLPNHLNVKPVVITILGGVVISGNNQDGWVGSYLECPLRVYLEKAPGVPAIGKSIEFDLRSAPKGSKLSATHIQTDEHGIAEIDVQLGKKQGQGDIGIRILDTIYQHNASYPTLKAGFFIIDRLNLVLGVLGGLAIFIFGMRMMSEGLSLVAGDKLRSLLNLLTNNRFAALGVGVTVTALIQSSSACTVMVIGFINAGLMQLEQAIGVIMGSNIGTTVTAQMISFKLDTLALPAVAIGVIMSLLAKKSRTRFAAQILVGFGLLFLGMGMMSGPLKELKASVTVQSLFDGLSCTPQPNQAIPLMGVLKAVMAGTLLTVIVQSSSASIGLLMALAGAGLLDPYTAFAILLGGNVGTTITAILAAIGSTLAAKRAACAHFLFNMFGTVIMIALFFIPWPDSGNKPIFMELVNHITPGDIFEGENIQRFLANAHTIFNIVFAFVLIGFVGTFATICRTVLPGEESDPSARTRRFLEPHLLATPSIALQQVWAELNVMLQKSHDAISMATQAIEGSQNTDWEEVAEAVRQHEDDIDALQHAITHYVEQLSQEALTEEQSQMLPYLLHAVNDIERIGDRSMHVLKLARRLRKRNIPLSPESQRDIHSMIKIVEELFVFGSDQIERIITPSAATIGQEESRQKRHEKAESKAKLLRKQSRDSRKAYEARQESGQEASIQSGVIFQDALLNINRAGGHIFNVIEAAENTEKITSQ